MFKEGDLWVKARLIFKVRPVTIRLTSKSQSLSLTGPEKRLEKLLK